MRLKAVFSHETPLIIFTTFSPASAGVALAAVCCAAFATSEIAVARIQLWLSMASFVLVTIGMAASMLHLAKPLRAPYAIIHWKESWLSREILAVAVFWAGCGGWLLSSVLASAQLLPGWTPLAADAAVVVLGAILIIAIGMAYRTEGQPAWRGPEVYAELSACALRCGMANAIAVIYGMCLSASPCVISPALACILAAVSFATAFWLDGWASEARISRLAKEDASTRILEVKELSGQWSTLASRMQVSLTAIGAAIALCMLILPMEPCAIACIAATVATFALQMVLRACFYGLFTNARTVPRFKANC